MPAIGPEKAGRIFYKANTDLFTASTTFEQAKTYTVQAAEALYGAGSAEASAVTEAWKAVGVPPPPPVVAPLSNGVPVSGLSGSAGNKKTTRSRCPRGQASLKFEISGGTGDADLYVRSGAVPSSSTYDCRPYKSGNAEVCTFTTPATGVYYIVLRGYSAYSGLSLKTSFTPAAGAYVFPNLSGAASSTQQLWAYNAAAGETVTIKISPNAGGSTGDADLYVKFGTAPSTTVYDCRPYLGGSTEQCVLTNPAAGTYYVMLRGYTAFTGVDLRMPVP